MTDPFASPGDTSPESTPPPRFASRLRVAAALAGVWLATVALGHLATGDRSTPGAASSSGAATCSPDGCCPSMTSIGLPESMLRHTLPADRDE